MTPAPKTGEIMRGTVLYGSKDIRFEEVPEPKLEKSTDAIIRLPVTCVCGSDLWPYRGIQPVEGPTPMGHEYCGYVEEVGSAVKSVKPGQFVVGSFAMSDNTCPHCRLGYQSSCQQREWVSRAQAPYMRVALADGTLVPTSDSPSNEMLPSLLAASDVLGTGWFAADAANVKKGSTVVVVGDGVARIKEMTNGIGADSVLECVGTQESMQQAIQSARPGGFVSYVGVPHGVELDGQQTFFAHVHLHGGPAPVRRYLPALIDLIVKDKIQPGKVFDLELPIEEVAEGYAAMDERRAVETLLHT